MKRLALDTSSVSCSVALEVDGRLFERYIEEPREHTRRLVPMIRDVLREADIAAADLDRLVLGNGPGSFIGLRIAAAVAQGIAHVAGIKIVPVSSLAALAAEVFERDTSDHVAVLQDAHMSEVYFGLYSCSPTKRLIPIVTERLQSIGAIPELTTLESSSCIAAGQAWQVYPELLDCNRMSIRPLSKNARACLFPKARYLFALADDNNALLPEQVEPTYLRAEVAKVPKPLDT